MEQITVRQLRRGLKDIFARVADDQEPISIIVDQERKVVILDADDYESLMETLFLLRSPANAKRLREGMRQHRQGQVKSIDAKAYLD